jgi:hypothetical protein
MNHSKLTQKQTLFLYAFLRQADRSLDKSRWTSIAELKTFYQNNIKPEQIINYLETHFNRVKKDSNPIVASYQDMSLKNKFRLFFQRNYLTADEHTHLFDLLVSFDQYLKSDSSYTTKTELLRIEIASFYSKVLARGISGRNLKKMRFTEHYEQNRRVKPFQLNKVVPEDFYNKKLN